MIEVLTALQCTQLGLLYSGLGLEEPTNNIVKDVAVTCILLGELTKPTQVDGMHTLKRFVAEVQDTMRFEGLEKVPLRS